MKNYRNQDTDTVAVDAGIESAVTEPRRVQLSRKKGWRKPPNTVVVARRTRWGNPFKVTPDYPAEQAVADYEAWLKGDGSEVAIAAKVELRGKNLACWCKPGQPCHAEVLLKLVNS